MKVNLIAVEVGVRFGRQHPEYNLYRIGALKRVGSMMKMLAFLLMKT